MTDDFEITFTQEQKIKRFVHRFKFDTTSDAFKEVMDDTKLSEHNGRMMLDSLSNVDMELWPIIVGDRVRRFVEKLLGRRCRCNDCSKTGGRWDNGTWLWNEDEEFHTICDRIHDGVAPEFNSLWNKFHLVLIETVKERDKQVNQKVVLSVPPCAVL